MDEVGGLEEAPMVIRRSVEWPLKHPEAFERLNVPRPKGVLIDGLWEIAAGQSDGHFVHGFLVPSCRFQPPNSLLLLSEIRRKWSRISSGEPGRQFRPSFSLDE